MAARKVAQTMEVAKNRNMDETKNNEYDFSKSKSILIVPYGHISVKVLNIEFDFDVRFSS